MQPLKDAWIKKAEPQAGDRTEAELLRRAKLQEQITAVAKAVPGFIFTIRVEPDGHTSFPFASAGVEDLFGLRPDEIRADATVLRSRYHQDDLPRILKLMEETGRTLAPFRIEIRIFHPVHGLRWIEIRSTPQRQPDNATEWHGVMLDITERKRTEEALQRLNRELRAISDCNQTLVRAVDEQTLLGDICRIVCDEAGYRLAWVGYVEHDDAKTVRPAAWAGFDSGYIANVKITWADNTELGLGPAGRAIRSGEAIYFQNVATDPSMAPWREIALQHGFSSGISLPLKDENAHVFGILLIYSAEIDAFSPDEIRLLEELAGDLAFGITVLRIRAEHKQTEEALAAREKEFRTLAENTPDTIARYDSECRRLFANHAFAELAGVAAEELLGRTPTAYNSSPGAVAYEERIRDVFKTGLIAEYEYNWPDRDGRLLTSQIRIVPEFDQDGQVKSVWCVGRDITESKQAVKTLLAKQQKLTEMAVALSMAEERERRRIATELHDHISQTLMLEKLKLRSLGNALAGAKEQKMLSEILALHDRLILTARSLTQQLSPPILANAGLEAALKWLCTLMEEDYGLQVQFVDDRKKKPLTEDMRAIVFQVCRELLINVAKHAGTNLARVAVAREGELLCLTVEDQGAGFDPSGTVSGSSWDSGFGLFNIRERIKHLGGTVELESAPGKGTRVTLCVALAGSSASLQQEIS